MNHQEVTSTAVYDSGDDKKETPTNKIAELQNSDINSFTQKTVKSSDEVEILSGPSSDKDKNTDLSNAIPRKKRQRLDSDEDNDDDDDDVDVDVSLNQLKRDILGRDLLVDNDNHGGEEEDDEIRQIEALMNAPPPKCSTTSSNKDEDNDFNNITTSNKDSTSSNFSSLPEKLRNDLICAM